MKDWWNWSQEELESVMNNAKKRGVSSVSIQQKNSNDENNQQVEQWLKEIGVRFEKQHQSTIIHVFN